MRNVINFSIIKVNTVTFRPSKKELKSNKMKLYSFVFLIYDYRALPGND